MPGAAAQHLRRRTAAPARSAARTPTSPSRSWRTAPRDRPGAATPRAATPPARVCRSRRRQRRVPQADEHHRRRDQQRDPVDDERRRQPQTRGQAAQHRPADRADQERRREHARDPAARVRRARSRIISPSDDTVNIADPMPPSDRNSQQLPIGLGERARRGRQRDDQQAADVDPPLPQPLHQQPAGRRRDTAASPRTR